VRAGDLAEQVTGEANRQLAARRAELTQERARLPDRLAAHTRRAEEIARTMDQPEARATAEATLTDELAAAAAVERRLLEVDGELRQLDRTIADNSWVSETLAHFNPVWAALTFVEQARLIELLIERVLVKPDRTVEVIWRSHVGGRS
jgi:hypothetical protein